MSESVLSHLTQLSGCGIVATESERGPSCDTEKKLRNMVKPLDTIYQMWYTTDRE